jgi:hypothetical protein
VAKSSSVSFPTKKSAKQEAFEKEARESLENADMGLFDKFMKTLRGAGKTSKKSKT